MVHEYANEVQARQVTASNTLCCQDKMSHVFKHNMDPLEVGFR
jgi:hypothetical protein